MTGKAQGQQKARTGDAVADGFLESLCRENTHSPASLSALECDLRNLARLKGKRPWDSLTVPDIRSFVASEHRRGLIPSSLRRMLSSWRKFFAHLADKGMLETNPAKGVRSPKGARLLPKVLTPDQVSKLFAKGNGGKMEARDKAMYETAYSSALRVSELVGLDCEDVDMEGRVVKVRHGKGGKEREVPIGNKAITALQEWLALRGKLCIQPGGALFTNDKGRRLTTRSAQLRLKKMADATNLQQTVTPHMLRHSCASHLLQSSGDLRGVQEMLGHSDVGSTQIYTHLDFQSLAKTYDKAHPRAKRASVAKKN